MSKRNPKAVVPATQHPTETKNHVGPAAPLAAPIDVASSVDIHDPSARRAALAACKASALAIPDEALAPRNLAPIDSAALVLTRLPSIRALRAQMQAELVAPPLAQLDALETTALATYQAELEAGVPAHAPSEVYKLYQTTILPRRRRFFAVADLLVDAHLLDPARVEATRRGTSHHDEAASMMAMAGVLRDVWPSIESSVPITLADLDAADVAGQEFFYALTNKNRPSTHEREAERVRDGMMTLLIQRYDDVRRAVSFLRWAQDDADQIAPSLFSARNKPRRNQSDPSTASPVPHAA